MAKQRNKQPRHLLSRIIRRWLAYLTLEAWPFWLVVLPLVLVMLSFWNWGLNEQTVRIAGLALELLGLSITAVQIKSKTSLLRVPTVLQRLARYWQKRPRWRVQTIRGSAGISVGSALASARGFTGPNRTSSLEERLAALERKHEALFVEVGHFADDLRKTGTEIREEIARINRETAKEIAEVRNRFDGALSEGIPVEWIGVLFFTFGLILSTIPEEISGWLGYIFR